MSDKAKPPVAIIGMGCVLPAGPDVATFWQSLEAGRGAVRTCAGPRWDWNKYGSLDPTAVDRTTSFLGATVDDFEFSWKKFRMPPVELRIMHTMEMMLLEAAHQAMVDGGYPSERVYDRQQVATIVGTSGMGRKSNHGFNFKRRLPEILAAAQQTEGWQGLSPQQRARVLGDVRERFVERFIDGSDDWAFWGFMSPALGRIASHFDLRGPHFCVDAHGASGLLALETAIAGLTNRTWDMALVGATSPALSPMELVLHSKLRRLSTTGVFPLDARADGTALGEGAVMLLIKRLDDAERSGDTIHAIVRGVEGVSRGRGPTLTGTDPTAHRRAAQATLLNTGLSPDTVVHVETGATGVVNWDIPTLSGLADAYGGGHRIAVGAIAETVGDLQAASSLAALLKVVHTLKTRRLLPQRTWRTPHPEMRLEAGPFAINAESTWPSQGPARAAVHAAGFGGVAYHAILEEYQPSRQSTPVGAIHLHSEPEPIAIVGLACRYPGADSPEELWENTVQGRSVVTEISRDRWPVELYRYPGGQVLRGKDALFKVYAPMAGSVAARPFSPAEFGISPASAAQMDPTQIWCLQTAREALADAGYDASRALPAERTAVLVATSPGNQQEVKLEARFAYPEFDAIFSDALHASDVAAVDLERVLTQTRALFLADGVPTNSETLPGMLDSAPAARIARHFDLRGPAFTVESACASSLAAIALAVQGLRDGRWDVALTGGVWSQITAPYCVNMCFVGVVSPSGETRPFSGDADGFVHGEGCGMFVLKRLSDARRDGDRIHALILGTGGASDGRGRSIVASQQRGQELAMRRALEDGGVPPSTVQYIEAHGTGMQEGDIPEAGALLAVYGRKQAPPAVSSLKPLIGHSYIASGAAAVLRTVWALKRKTRPPLVTGATLNPDIRWDDELALLRTAQAWTEPAGARRAAVNGYGFGGTTFHLLLEEYTG